MSSIYYPPSNWVSEIFEESYPFEVWEDRLEGISKCGSLYTKVYSITESLLILVEAYATVLTGSFGNPALRWMAIEEFSPPTNKQAC